MSENKQGSGADAWDDQAIQKMQKILDKVEAGKKLTKLEESKLFDYDNDHVIEEFTLEIGLNRDFSDSEKQKIIDVCVEAVRKLGYHEVMA